MKSLKIYIASSFDESDACERLRKLLVHHGHTVPDVWWNVKTKDDFKATADADFYASPLVQAIAIRH